MTATAAVAPAAFHPGAMATLGTLLTSGYTIQTSLQPYRAAWDIHFYGPRHEEGPHGVVRVGVKSGRLLGGYVRRDGEAGAREDLPRPALARVIRELPPVRPVSLPVTPSPGRATPRGVVGWAPDTGPSTRIADRHDADRSLIIEEQPHA